MAGDWATSGMTEVRGGDARGTVLEVQEGAGATAGVKWAVFLFFVFFFLPQGGKIGEKTDQGE